jgi:two-component system cell cycle response regulator DivK
LRQRVNVGRRLMSRILLIEDNNLIRDMLSLRLRRKGYDMLTAADGEAGVAMAARERPDLVLMDISLPGLDGWAAARLLKGTPHTADIPIIALTAHDMECVKDKALAAGFDGYDTKPIDFERLLDKMEALLKNRDLLGAGL